MKASLLFPFILLFLLSNIVFAQNNKENAASEMNNKKMEAIFKAHVEEIEGQLGSWQMVYGGTLLIVLTDETNNRMRIFSPVFEEKKLDKGQMKKMLEANFHSALDAKYSLYEGFVVSVFTHPLRELSNDQLVDAMQQVVVLSKTFGDSYSSTGLIFGQPQEEEKKEQEEKKKLNKKPKKT